MRAAEKFSPRVEALSWAEICERFPKEWVCLVDVEKSPDGSIRSGRLIGHDHSMRKALAHTDEVQSDTVVAHTSGRPLRTPRIEMTDEIRDIIRPRR